MLQKLKKTHFFLGGLFFFLQICKYYKFLLIQGVISNRWILFFSKGVRPLAHRVSGEIEKNQSDGR